MYISSGCLGCLKDGKKSLELTEGDGICLCTCVYFTFHTLWSLMAVYMDSCKECGVSIVYFVSWEGTFSWMFVISRLYK